MATLHFRDAFLQVNAVNLSSHVESITINYSAEMLDETAMGDSTRIRKGGLKGWSIDVNFHQDLAAGAVDATLFSLVGTTACIEVRPQNICSTVANPRYEGIGVLETYNPMGGTVGSLLDAPATWQSAGDLSRTTAAT